MLPHTLQLDVDCTNIYGRLEINADGRGSALPLSSRKKKKDENVKRLPMKRCTVYISTSLLALLQPVSVLLAALSSRVRISRDKDGAGKIARMLDEVSRVKAGSRLADLLRLLNPGTKLHSVDVEDVLDVSIAYLRHVLLFLFYNGSDVGNVLLFSHPTGMIHLRLKGAD